MKTKRYGQSVLNIDKETIENVNSIIEHTPSYNKNERNGVINKNLRIKAHPYYTEYRPLQTLCLQILRMEEMKYGESEDEICGILFDGAWLWEEYVNTILNKQGYIHPENKLHKGGIYLFEGHSGIRYPDFYKDDMVLDAKYKRLGSYNNVSMVDPDDVHQVIAYMSALHVDKGGFIAPLEKKQEKVPTSRIYGTSSNLYIFGIEISKTSSSYVDFCEMMAQKEQEFVKSLAVEELLE
jgi:5-methylcytosine-specific restriction endonuclease McrBC regulatory subunit McrC